MSLRWELSIIIAAIFISVIGAIFVISEFTFMRNFQAVEVRNAQQMAVRASEALNAKIQSLNTLNQDWAVWDDTYNFVQDPAANQQYLESNPTDMTFSDDELNFILIIDNSGHLVFGKAFNLFSGSETPIPDSLNEYIFSATLTNHTGLSDYLSGIILLPEGPLMISSQPILTSLGEGPIEGTIIMGRYLDQSAIEEISNTVQLPLSMMSMNDAYPPTDFQAARSSLTAAAQPSARPLDSQSIAGYAQVNDIFGKPALILKIVMPRDIYAHSVDTLRYFLILLGGLVILSGTGLNNLLRRVVISRLERTSGYVRNISVSGDLSERLKPTGNDEITNLDKGINIMVESLQEAQQSLQAQKKAEETLRLTIESVAEGISRTDLTGKINDANDSKILLHGFPTKEQLIGMNLLDLIAAEEGGIARKAMEKILETGLTESGEYTMQKADGSKFYGELSVALFNDADGNPAGFITSTKDITARKSAQNKIKASLAEKEVILKEIHHRVKNNMQVISSLLNMQSKFVKDKNDAQLFQESRQRIYSMSLVYNQLYESQDLAHIGFTDYVNELVSGLIRSYNSNTGTITTRIEAGGVELGLDLAIPCGLIINEVISNSLKYAFPNGRPGEIRVIMRNHEGRIEMSLGDNGVGIPPEIDINTSKTLGMSLLQTLAMHQLGGTLELKRENGTEYFITFPDEPQENRV